MCALGISAELNWRKVGLSKHGAPGSFWVRIEALWHWVRSSSDQLTRKCVLIRIVRGPLIARPAWTCATQAAGYMALPVTIPLAPLGIDPSGAWPLRFPRNPSSSSGEYFGDSLY